MFRLMGPVASEGPLVSFRPYLLHSFDMPFAADNEDKKLLDTWSSVIVHYNSIGRGVR